MNYERLFDDDVPKSRFLSQEECVALARRAASMAVGDGETGVQIESIWRGNIRYARNQILSSGDTRNNPVNVIRSIRGAMADMESNQIQDIPLQASIRRAERALTLNPETGGPPFQEHFVQPAIAGAVKGGQSVPERRDSLTGIGGVMQTPEPHARPKIFFDSTYHLGAEQRAASIGPLLERARDAGMVGAGYIEVSAHGRAVIDTFGRALYYPFTRAQFSVTIRDPKGLGSGWAGVDWADWKRLDANRLSDIALAKCLRSRNPVAIEPGRYTTILEPQAVHDLFSPVLETLGMVEQGEPKDQLWNLGERFKTKIGLKILDERITVSADPHDSELGFPPFSREGAVYNPVTWFENGVLRNLSYDREYGIKVKGENKGLPNSRAYRMSGGPTSIDEMISTTKRGVLVTRFSQLSDSDGGLFLVFSGYTRDGLWLIEDGKISKAIKNFRFTDSPLFAFNNLEQLGEPVRVFSPQYPAIVPPAKVRDFNFSSLTDAI